MALRARVRMCEESGRSLRATQRFLARESIRFTGQVRVRRFMMKSLLLAALPAALLGQALEGTWQGTLTPVPNREIRMAFKIGKDGNGYQGMYYNIDARRQFNLGAITQQGNALKIVIPGMGGTYEGKLDADGN